MRDKGLPVGGGLLSRTLAVATLMAGAALTTGGPARSVEGLCNGQEASHPWLNASGQRGPALIDWTPKNDVIIGSDGDDTINGKGGDDVICGERGYDSISGGPGNDTLRGDSGDDDDNQPSLGLKMRCTAPHRGAQCNESGRAVSRPGWRSPAASRPAPGCRRSG